MANEFEATTAVNAEKLESARRQSIADLDDMSEEEVAAARVRLGPMTRVPRLAKNVRDIDVESTRMAYLLAFVDGILTLDLVVAAAGLPEREAVVILEKASREGLITLAG